MRAQQADSASGVWLYLGPLLVIVGAALWGLESFFRLRLNQVFDSGLLVFYEHIFCLAFALPALIWTRPSWSGISSKAWLYLILSGSIGSAIGTYFFTLSLGALNPSVANILLNFQPLISVFFARFLLDERFGHGFFLWAGVALAAGMVIVLSDAQWGGQNSAVGFVYALATALSWGFATVAGRGAMGEIPLALAAPGRFLIGTITMFVSLLLQNKFSLQMLPAVFVPDNLSAFISLSLVTGVIPLYFYFKGLQKTSAMVGAFSELTQTFSALVVTWGVLGHALTILQTVAGGVLVLAVFQISRAQSALGPR